MVWFRSRAVDPLAQRIGRFVRVGLCLLLSGAHSASECYALAG
jgi:hypothetical protein